MKEYWVTVPYQAQPIVVWAEKWSLTDRAISFLDRKENKIMAFNNSGGWLSVMRVEDFGNQATEI